ncbi:hypothetical protein SCHPADRAFT_947986, partial [Schizopora paradoxa]
MGPVVERHPFLYFQDGSIVIRADNTLYKVFASILSDRSQVFRDCFSLPRPQLHGDGLDDENPVLLPDSAFDVNNLFHFLFSVRSELALDEEHMASLLQISHKYGVQEARDHAINALDTMVQLTPVKRISLARACEVDYWLEPAFRDLLKGPLDLTLEEAKLIGITNFYLISRAKRKADLLRISFALSPPRILESSSG